MKITFEQAVILFAQKYREQQLNLIAKIFRNDGGPGSGNWGHEGVPGQVGGSAPGNGSRQVVEGKDISRTYNGDRSTKAVIEAQGFGGLPKIVGKKEFDKAVKKSKFIAQRSITASSQEILDAYRNDLFNGDFYVDCTVGGAGFGQGLYCAADYNGELSDGIKEEMQHYRKIGDRKFGRPSYEETKQKALNKIEEQYKDDPDYDEICRYAEEVCKPDWTMATFVDADLTIEQVSQVENIVRSVKQQTDAPDYTATMTLDPSAKIVDYDTIEDMLSTERTERWYQAKQDTVRTETEKLGLQGGALDYFRQRLGLQNVDPYDDDAAEEWKSKASRKELQSVNKEADRIALWALTEQKVVEEMYKDLDIGAYAALKGYDAINARGHGASGSYTVILNRTKTIFLDDDIHEDAKDEDGKITFQIGKDGVTYAIRNRKVIGWVAVSDCSDKKDDRADGGPGSGNFGHKGVPGQVGGSAPSDVSEGAFKPTIGSLEPANDFESWQRANLAGRDNPHRAELTKLYKEHGFEAVQKEYLSQRTQASTGKPHLVDDRKADEIIADKLPQNVFLGWFRNADSNYKPRVIDAITTTPETRNAALSIMYENYRQLTGGQLSYEEFLTTPVKMYRGGHGQKHTEADIFSSYSFSKSTAGKFGSTVYETEIRPIDTWGSVTTNKESEIMVPFWIAPNGNKDSRNDSKRKILGVNDLRFAFEMARGFLKKRFAKSDKYDIVKSETNLDADDPDSWITMPNGVHVPVKNGKAIGGPIIGKPLKEVGKTKPLTSFRISKRMSPQEYAKVQKALNRHFEGTGIDKKIGKHCGRFVDPNFYIFVPHDFNEYEYKFRIPIVGDEDVINEWRTLFDDREWK